MSSFLLSILLLCFPVDMMAEGSCTPAPQCTPSPSPTTFQCNTGTCYIDCIGSDSCNEIICDSGTDCIVTCQGSSACIDGTIDASAANQLSITVQDIWDFLLIVPVITDSATDALTNMLIKCPINGGGSTCEFSSSSTSLFSQFDDLIIEAQEGFNDISFGCLLAVVDTCIGTVTIKCGDEYQYSCLMLLTSLLTICTSSSDQTCNDYLLPQPTYNPTTQTPTTDVPTTIAPTTSIPTTIPPTTSIPTSVPPTTSAPSTTFPSTFDPTTSLPTTVMPSTAIPTTFNATTSKPTSHTPTTATPTTFSPTAKDISTTAPTDSPSSRPTPGSVRYSGTSNFTLTLQIGDVSIPEVIAVINQTIANYINTLYTFTLSADILNEENSEIIVNLIIASPSINEQDVIDAVINGLDQEFDGRVNVITNLKSTTQSADETTSDDKTYIYIIIISTSGMIIALTVFILLRKCKKKASNEMNSTDFAMESTIPQIDNDDIESMRKDDADANIMSDVSVIPGEDEKLQEDDAERVISENNENPGIIAKENVMDDDDDERAPMRSTPGSSSSGSEDDWKHDEIMDENMIEGNVDNNKVENDPEISSDSVDYSRSSASDPFYDENWCDAKVTNFNGLKDSEINSKQTIDSTTR